jgi:F0F1-type ATP synthase epsilon subunit
MSKTEKFKNNFRCSILSPKNLIFENEVNSLFIIGNSSEYELLAYHYPLIGLVQKGDIIIDWKRRIPVMSGILSFFANECTILIEEAEDTFAAAKNPLDQAIKM